MAGITLEQAEQRLQQYLDAEAKILAGQDVVMFGQRLTRADLSLVQDGIKIWNRRVVSLDPSSGSGAIRVREVIPR